MPDNGEIKTPEAIEKMKKALNKLKPHLMGESVDAMTIIVEGEKKKRDKSISKRKIHGYSTYWEIIYRSLRLSSP